MEDEGEEGGADATALGGEDELGRHREADYIPSIKDWILHRPGKDEDPNKPIKKPAERRGGLSPDLGQLAVLYECKDDCKTILDSSHIREMERFSALALDDERWGRTCSVLPEQQPQDGEGCTG